MRPSDQSSGVNLPSRPGHDIDDHSDLKAGNSPTATPSSKRTVLGSHISIALPGPKDSVSTLGEKSRLFLSSTTQSIPQNINIPPTFQESKASTTVASTNINPSTWSPVVSSEPKPAQTVESLKEAFTSHLIQTQMRTRKKSRLDRQILQDSPPAQSPPSASSTSTIREPSRSNLSSGTSSQQPVLPTPSYPFPVMGHRTSLTMSPTGFEPRDRAVPSGNTTPASVLFNPPGINNATQFENPDFPSPNLYELALSLYSEPGLESFWHNLVQIMMEDFRAERVSLALPTDLTDLENTPWGQKASYNEADGDALSLTYMEENDKVPASEAFYESSYNRHRTKEERREGGDDYGLNDGMQDLQIEDDSSNLFSPVVVEFDKNADQSTDISEWGDAVEAQEDTRLPSEHMGGVYPSFDDNRLHGRVFTTLQPLNYEGEALIDGAGIIRVLERGKTVVLSREYRDIQSKLAVEKESRLKFKKERAAAQLASELVESPSVMPPTPGITNYPADTNKPPQRWGSSRRSNMFPTADDFRLRLQSDKHLKNATRGSSYEEYEQAPSSPWSQSPAPSPAIRQDPSENPFFIAPKIDEDSFNPSVTSPEYSANEQVNAIGMENAATVIHIPLIHPSSDRHRRTSLEDSTGGGHGRRSPIAIVSILSSVIPYPTSLVHCLSHFAPLMATAFSLSQAYSVAATQLSHFQFRQQQQQQSFVGQDRLRDPLGGRDLLSGRDSSIISMTSPSECTRSSPSNSIVGTPNLDAGIALAAVMPGQGDRKSPANSPLPSAMIGDSYFASRQRKIDGKRRVSNNGNQTSITSEPGQSYPTKSLSRPALTERDRSYHARPSMSRLISEVMGKNAGSTEASRLASSLNLGQKDSQTGSLARSQPPSSNSSAEHQDNEFYDPENKDIPTEGSRLRLDLSGFHGQRAENTKSQSFGIPDSFPLPSSIPATPYGVPLPPTPYFTPMIDSGSFSPVYKHENSWTTFGYDDSSPSNRVPEPNKMNFPTTNDEHVIQNKPLPTPFVPSVTQDLNAVQSVLEESSFPFSTPNIEDGASNTKAQTSKAEKHHSRRKNIIRRHSSDLGIFQHTRLHSYGADLGASFQTSGMAGSDDPISRYTAHMRGDHGLNYLHQSYMPPPSNKLLRTIIDAIPVHVFTAAPQTGDITWVNSRMLSYRGTTAQEFTANPYEPLHPDDVGNYVKMWMAAVRKGEPFSAQMRVRRFDGNYRWFMTRAVPLRDSRGIIVHWFGTNMDVHDQRLAELNAARQAEMAESESKYRSLANSSPQIVFAATLNMGITFANNQWLDYSGQTLNDALQLGFMEAVHPADRYKCSLPGFTAERIKTKLGEQSQGAWFSPVNSLKAETQTKEPKPAQPKVSFATKNDQSRTDSQMPFSTELRLRDRNGGYRWHLVRCVSVEANVEGLWFGTCTDINDHKLLEQKLKEANEAAQKSMESKTRFLSNMSHEIRTPLIGISGMINFLLDTPLNGEQLDYCHTISSSSDGLLMVINDILDLSKVEAGMMRLTSELFRVRSLVEDVNELLSTLAISKDLELNYLVENDVPKTVSGDRIRLRQVILNVVGNAIKFTSEGEIFTRCYLISDDTLSADEVMIGFECHDTGPGFDEKEEALMFKPFSQIDGSSTRAHGGSGLGLVISRQLVELHGGKMTATSEKGKGSIFFFTAKCHVPKKNIEEEPTEASTQGGIRKAPSLVSQPSDSSIRTTASLVFSDGVNTALVESPASAALTGSSTSSLRVNLPLPPVRDPNTMHFKLPANVQKKALHQAGSPPSSPGFSKRSSSDLSVGKALIPPMFSILVLASLHYSRIAISHHIKMILPRTIPNQITVAEDIEHGVKLLGGEDPVVFTHIILNLSDIDQTMKIVNLTSNSAMHSITTLVVLTTPMQRTAIIERDAKVFDKMGSKVQFIYKPIKPSRLGVIFDPTKERDASMDRYRHTAQQVVESQKAVFSDMVKEVGNKGHRVLLVEDNPVNQKVLLRFLGRVGMEVEIASDGVECVNKVLEHHPGYYGVILCDLHMPRKDGFEACTEIRTWEKERSAPLTPIIALSANVMSDVAERCAAAGFSRYVSKPVDFKILGNTIKELLDPTKSQTLMQVQQPL